MTNTKHEDAILKMGVEYFREHILKMIGINYTYEEIAPTELVELTINELYMDFTFKTTDRLYIHIEFQTTNTSEPADLRRFHSYEALFSHNTGMKVITYVIYTGGIKVTKGELDCGAYTYRVIPVYMGEKNADVIIEKLKVKKNTGQSLTEDDFAWLSLTPLMGGEMSRKDKIKESILLAKDEHTEISGKVTAMLYALADKFLSGNELDEIKEVVTMTRLGQMIMEDGIQKGMQQGIQQGEKQGERKIWTLNKCLYSANRIDDLQRAIDDPAYQKQLLEEFGIK